MNKTFELLHFLPQSPHTLISDNSQALNLLILYQYFIEQTLLVLEYVFNEAWWMFDPQVGENQCQIRAYQLLQLCVELKLLKPQLREQYKALQQLYIRFFSIKEKYATNKINYFSTKVALDVFLIKENLLVFITEPIFYLVQSRFLTIFAKKDDRDMYIGINYDALCQTVNISKTLARKIVHQFQCYLSEVSYIFVKSLLYRYPSLSRFKMIMPLLTFHDEEGRKVFSLYFTTVAIMRDFIKQTGFVVLEVKDLDYTTKKYSFYVQNNTLISQIFSPVENAECLVLRAQTQFDLKKEESRFLAVLSANFKLMILANEAAHPQYPGKLLSSKKSNPFTDINLPCTKQQKMLRQFENYFSAIQKQADVLGCTQSNACLLFIEHIFCSTLAHEMERHPTLSGLMTDQTMA